MSRLYRNAGDNIASAQKQSLQWAIVVSTAAFQWVSRSICLHQGKEEKFEKKERPNEGIGPNLRMRKDKSAQTINYACPSTVKREKEKKELPKRRQKSCPNQRENKVMQSAQINCFSFSGKRWWWWRRRLRKRLDGHGPLN